MLDRRPLYNGYDLTEEMLPGSYAGTVVSLAEVSRRGLVPRPRAPRALR